MIESTSHVRGTDRPTLARVIQLVDAYARELDRRAVNGQTSGRLAVSDVDRDPSGSATHDSPNASGDGVVYTAPEVLMGASAGPWSDQYALACVATQLLTGTDEVDVVGWRHGVLRQPKRHPIDVALLRATDPDPARRFTSSTEFAHALGGSKPSGPGWEQTTPPATTQRGPAFALVSFVVGLSLVCLRLIPVGHLGTLIFDSFPYSYLIIPLVFGMLGLAIGIVGCVGPRKMKSVTAVGIFLCALCVLYGGARLILVLTGS
ncbi:hypothetical protein GOEFS_069_00290 [Gordonia effusa NBRC 100432]|uniref:Serine/threonine protein kinase n=1 Tax=Gordonia effusa NBRC 100432 TaxID=1077974 RepID=H0R1F2_9ACTN|nr:hypothetical protein [Gordonia effusa]GAB18903.1 hypothetical protein GOEFS_069_00290 [Gordonia effusa NBRC 100432]